MRFRGGRRRFANWGRPAFRHERLTPISSSTRRAKIFSTCFLPPMKATFAHTARTGGARGQVGVASCDRCRRGRGRGLGGRACRRGAGCTARNRDRFCARRTGAIHPSRQAVLLVSLRLGGRRLVLVGLWHLSRRRLGRQLRLERLGRAATLPRRAGRTPVSLLAGALSAVPWPAGHQLASQQRSDGGWLPPLRLSRRLLILAGEQRSRKLRRITTLMRRMWMVLARRSVRLHDLAIEVQGR